MSTDCPFCRNNNLLVDEPLAENSAFYVLGMRDKSRRHGVMIVLNRHVVEPFDIRPDEWATISEPLAFAKAHLAPFQAAGHSIGWNVGAVGGQHVAHVHMHVICRFANEPSSGLGINGLILTVNQARPS